MTLFAERKPRAERGEANRAPFIQTVREQHAGSILNVHTTIWRIRVREAGTAACLRRFLSVQRSGAAENADRSEATAWPPVVEQ